MKTLIATLILLLLPYTLRAQQSDSSLVTRWSIDSMGIGTDHDTASVLFNGMELIFPTDTIFIPNPDSSTLFTIGTVKRLIDSALAAQGRWVMVVTVPRSVEYVVDTMVYLDPRPCTTWVWTHPAKEKP